MSEINIQQQHLINYKNACSEIIKNNNNMLANEDILSLLVKPPLDSMDVIKQKLVNLCKSNEVIINTEIVDEVLSKYRNKNLDEIIDICQYRYKKLIKVINDYIDENGALINISPNVFLLTRRELKKNIKKMIKRNLDLIRSNFHSFFKEGTDEVKKATIIKDIEKYIYSEYIEELLKNIELKLVIKDTILANSLLEQGEHYLFAKSNSRLYKDDN